MQLIKPLARYAEDVLGNHIADDSEASSEATEETPKEPAPNPLLDPLIHFLLQQRIGQQELLEEPIPPPKVHVQHSKQQPVKKVERIRRDPRRVDNKKAYGRRKA
eukprot:CAMPEP_0118891062 /NCGR_PEP_ID=MMETSP1166-20130328/1232_1 /TAXON_ID=1104430 /ORGANISM="Chrysoreinhardia sp, Strain CCMP3193" /LENGTH=104 /DNA_ID=CAMNT_0006829697 /DNA_START=176 /DNA_END=490 /DNA_ORIENTATION=+